MICDLCGAVFGDRVTFASMFRPPRFCPACRRRHAPGDHFACVPIDGGLVRYRYVYGSENADNHLSVLLFDRLGPLFLAAEEWVAAGAAVVLLDLAEAAVFADWFPAVAAFRDVRFFSLFFFDPERFPGLV